MKALLILTVAWALAGADAFRTCVASEPHSALELAGKWNAEVHFGKSKFTLILKIAKTPEGRLAVTIDSPEQGQKDMPVNALLFNDPDIRLEIDQFGTSYTGKVNPPLTEITGGFDEGPGGRPMPLVFKRSTEPDLPEPEQVFTLASGEPPDIRGYWKGEIELGPGMTSRAGLKIGRIQDGTFRAALDLLDQGAKNLPATSLTTTNRSARFEWTAFQTVFDAQLSDDGRRLTGKWQQGARGKEVAFERLDSPATVFPANTSFDSPPGNSTDPRGTWNGTLALPGGNKLRLVMKIGKTPDDSLVASLASLDQGGNELPSSSASVSERTLKMEWKGIRGKFEGEISEDGKWLDGKWEQMGSPLPLKLERTNVEQKKEKTI